MLLRRLSSINWFDKKGVAKIYVDFSNTLTFFTCIVLRLGLMLLRQIKKLVDSGNGFSS